MAHSRKMPGPKCVVLNCSKVKLKSNVTRLAYHKFPRDPELKKRWFKKLGLENDGSDTGFVCSKHFKTDDYVRDLQAELLGYPGRRKLKPEAVPSVNLPFEEDEISPEEKERIEKERHAKLIEDCLNNSGEQNTVLSFELFKKLRYRNSRSRRKYKKNSETDDDVVIYKSRENLNENPNGSVVVVTLPSGDEHVVHIRNLEESEDLTHEDSTSDMTDYPTNFDTTMDTDDPDYLKKRVKQLEGQVNHQKKIICSLRRQIIREKKMMEKIILATNTGEIEAFGKKKTHYDENERSALLQIYSMAPHLYPNFSKVLNFPPQNILSTWETDIVSQQQKANVKNVQPDGDEQEENFVEEEFIIESEDFVDG